MSSFPNKEQLLKLWFESEPTARSPYGLYGNPPMWKTLEDGDLTLFTCFKETVMVKSVPYGTYDKKTSGLMYMWQRNGEWVGQGVETTFEEFEKRGPGKYDIPEVRPPDEPSRKRKGRKVMAAAPAAEADAPKPGL